MSTNDDFAAMLAEFESQQPKADRRRPKPGDTVKGPIISIGKEAVFIDVGGKAEGVIARGEVTDREGNLTVKVGDLLEARVVGDAGGVLQLRTRIARGPEAKAELVSACELGIPVEGTVTEAIKGGVSVDVAGVRGFCPASQLDNRFIDDVAVFVGQRHTFLITKYEPNPRGGNLVLSRRALVEAEAQKKFAEIKDQLVPGAVVRGKVISFKPFGAFVDIGGVEGMLHVSQLGHGRVNGPEDVLTIGQELDVQILKIEPDEKSKRGGDRISLSLKGLVDDPWKQTVSALSVGGRIAGKITRLQPFGAFVEIAPGVEGLIHISELGAGRRINHPKEVVEEGKAVEATILAIDLDKRRLSLTLADGNDAAPDEIAAVTRPTGGSAKFGTFADLLNKRK